MLHPLQQQELAPQSQCTVNVSYRSPLQCQHCSSSNAPRQQVDCVDCVPFDVAMKQGWICNELLALAPESAAAASSQRSDTPLSGSSHSFGGRFSTSSQASESAQGIAAAASAAKSRSAAKTAAATMLPRRGAPIPTWRYSYPPIWAENKFVFYII